ncbi:MAG: hypothetical protein ACI9Z3_001295 [Roseivirga sp.]|jgi:hypothetical protein
MNDRFPSLMQEGSNLDGRGLICLESLYLFLFNILTISFLTTSISSGLLAAAKSVRLANASLLIIVVPSSLDNTLLRSRNNRKQAAAILLLPSVNA